MRIFHSDSPLMEALSRLFDLTVLNLLVILLCLPVLTAGAALTGMHYVLLKMARREEGYVARSFFGSFRRNFRQATILWLLFLSFAGIFVLDMGLTGEGAASGLSSAFRLPLAAFAVYVYGTWLYAFPLLARFQNTIPGTLKSAALLAALALPRTLAMAAVSLLPAAILWFCPPLLPLFFFLGFTGPGLFCARLYSPVFQKIENKDRDGNPKTGQDRDPKTGQDRDPVGDPDKGGRDGTGL